MEKNACNHFMTNILLSQALRKGFQYNEKTDTN